MFTIDPEDGGRVAVCRILPESRNFTLTVHHSDGGHVTLILTLDELNGLRDSIAEEV